MTNDEMGFPSLDTLSNYEGQNFLKGKYGQVF
jgi:hypothetical protein